MRHVFWVEEVKMLGFGVTGSAAYTSDIGRRTAERGDPSDAINWKRGYADQERLDVYNLRPSSPVWERPDAVAVILGLA